MLWTTFYPFAGGRDDCNNLRMGKIFMGIVILKKLIDNRKLNLFLEGVVDHAEDK
jgi:hypothetical protein